jgi:hypothetical protein
MFNPVKPNTTTTTTNNQIYPTPSAYHLPQQQQPMFNTKNEYSPLMNIQQQQQMRFQIFNNMSHSKSYSLPANFQDQQFMITAPKMQPPPRSISSNGDIPLPNGWELEKTTTGQAYYIK